MGLITAALGATVGVLGGQWKEYFYCDSLPADVLVVKGKKKNGSVIANDNIISNGSGIVVADGQCMVIVDNGKIAEFCAEPGQFTYDASSEPSLFDGGKLGDNIKKVFSEIGRRFTYGGSAAKDQRVYYFNTKEIMGNKYGTPQSVPFRVVDERAGIDMDISVKCFGEYSYKVTNPILFYTNVCGNVADQYTRQMLDSQLKSELLSKLQETFALVSARGIRYSELPGQTTVMTETVKNVLDWSDRLGIEVCKLSVSSVKADEADEATIKELQKNAAYKDPSIAMANYLSAKAQAMKDAANNAGGANIGFMSLNAASQDDGTMAMLNQMNQNAKATAPAADSWTCASCGKVVTGKFCPECGAKRVVVTATNGWTCTKCGAVNQGKFCSECGEKKPAGALTYKCDKCGWMPADPTNPPKYCPECGDLFDDSDIVK